MAKETNCPYSARTMAQKMAHAYAVIFIWLTWPLRTSKYCFLGEFSAKALEYLFAYSKSGQFNLDCGKGLYIKQIIESARHNTGHHIHISVEKRKSLMTFFAIKVRRRCCRADCKFWICTRLDQRVFWCGQHSSECKEFSSIAFNGSAIIFTQINFDFELLKHPIVYDGVFILSPRNRAPTCLWQSVPEHLGTTIERTVM